MQEAGLDLAARTKVCEHLLAADTAPAAGAIPQAWTSDKALLMLLMQLRCQELTEQLSACEARLQDAISTAAAEVSPAGAPSIYSAACRLSSVICTGSAAL